MVFVLESLLDSFYNSNENNDASNFIFKLSLLGDGCVGKTSLCSALEAGVIPGSYDITVGLEIRSKEIANVDGTNVRLVLWDLAGQERFSCVRDVFYNGTNIAAVVFDVNNRGSFYDIHQWVRELKRKEKDVPMILVGNKIDLVGQREVSREEAEEVANQYGIIYVETSAKTGENVQETFRAASTIALRRAMKGKTVAY